MLSSGNRPKAGLVIRSQDPQAKEAAVLVVCWYMGESSLAYDYFGGALSFLYIRFQFEARPNLGVLKSVPT